MLRTMYTFTLKLKTLGLLLSILVQGLLCQAISQDTDSLKRFSVKGYVSDLQSAIIQQVKGNWIKENTLHNRLNFFFYPSASWKASVQLRNRLIYGDYFVYFPGYASSFAHDRGFAPLSFNLTEGNSFLLNTQVDRIYAEYSKGKVDITAGRQRINWSQTLVWNPNDIFNNYSFFDFDYEEKPGADALRIQYFTGAESVIEMAGKVDSAGKITAAGLFRFNHWGYDIQFLAGMLEQSDLALGLGWSGSIGGAAFRGEAGYYRPFSHFMDTRAIFQLSLGSDYSFSNSLFLQAEVLYSFNKLRPPVINLLDYYSAPLSVKNLSFTDWNIFMQASYPITPLINSSMALMVFPRVSGYYVGPTLSFSVAENFSFSTIVQLFSGKFPAATGTSPGRENFGLVYLRFKYSF